jgi:hypothetical protein
LGPTPPPRLPEQQLPNKLTRQAAWACLVSNLVLPGLGTLAAHRRSSGLAQVAISQIGFALSVLWAILFMRDWVHQGEWPTDITPSLGIGVLGSAMFFLAWIWSLVTSFKIIRDSCKSDL